MELLSELIPEKGICKIIEDYKRVMEYQDLIKKYKYDWCRISIKARLSEEFIDLYSDKVYWSFISSHQTLTDDFIIKYKHRVEWNSIIQFQLIPFEKVLKHCDNLNTDFLVQTNTITKEQAKQINESQKSSLFL